MKATKHVVTYAIVEDPKTWREFRVWPDGAVGIWKCYDDHWDWYPYESCENDYDEIRAIGLEALK